MSVTSASLGASDRLLRQRRATWRVWQEDARTRPDGGWADLGGLVVHATGIPVRHWNGAHLLYPGVDAMFSVGGTEYPDRVTGLKLEGGKLSGTALLPSAQPTHLPRGG